MKTRKNKLTNLLKIGIFLFGISSLLWNCEKEEIDNNLEQHIGKNPNQVSIDFFKEDTKISSIKNFIKKNRDKPKKHLKRNSQISFSDFTIDSSKIYKYELETGSLSFSFHIKSKKDSISQRKYNLVIKQDEKGDWKSSIFEFTINQNSSNQKKFSSIEKILEFDGLPYNNKSGFYWSETTNYHCTGTGDCASGVCDDCNLCVSTSIGYEYYYNPSEEEEENEIENAYDGEGGGGNGYTEAEVLAIRRSTINNTLNLQPNTLRYVWINEYANIIQLNRINSLLVLNSNSTEAKNFALELIDVIKTNQTIDQNAFIFTIEAFNKNKIYNDLDSQFLNSVDQFINLDIATNPDLALQLQLYFTTKCAVLRHNNPTWSDAKIYWEASKDFVHIALDGFGMIPVVGEIADLTNGVLYLIEGDGVNATLSFAATVPIVGWGATTGKYVFKLTATTLGTKVRLTWKVLENGIVYFGSTGSQLRKVLGMAPYAQDARQAHHIIPWGKRTNEVIQKAAKSGNAFHINEALNGIPLDNLVHLGSHTNYDNRVIAFLNQLPASATPDQAYQHVTTLINKIRLAIANNPTTHIDNLIF